MRPSGLERRFLCPGSYHQEKGKPRIESDYAAAGTDLHTAVSEALINGVVPTFILAGKSADEEAVKSCLEYARMIGGEDAETRIECPLNVGECIPGMDPQGTPDYASYTPYGRGDIVDWKFTYIDPPGAENNLQLMSYAITLAMSYELSEVSAHIVLAFTGQVSTATWTYDELMQLREEIIAIIRRSLAPLAPLLPSEPACRYCDARPECPALLEYVSRFTNLTDERVKEMSGHQVAELLPIAGMVAKWSGALKQRAMGIALSGNLPGYFLKPGRRNRSWKPGVEIYQILNCAGDDAPEGLIEEDLMMERRVKSPAQIEKILGAKAKVKKSLEPLIDYREGSPQLKRMKEEIE